MVHETEEPKGFEKRGFTLDEAREYLGGLSRPTLYRMIRDGLLKTYHLGTRVFVVRESMDALVDEQIEEDANR